MLSADAAIHQALYMPDIQVLKYVHGVKTHGGTKVVAFVGRNSSKLTAPLVNAGGPT